MEKNLQKLHGIEVMSVINMSNGFGVLPIAKEDQHYLCLYDAKSGELGVQEVAQWMGKQSSLLHPVHGQTNNHTTGRQGTVIHR